jgi:adenosine deaminase
MSTHAPPVLTDEELRQIPKVELHRHLEGSIRPSTAVELMRASGRATADESDAAVLDRCVCGTQVGSLVEALARFDVIQALMATPKIIERITFEVCEDAWNEGTRVLEIRLSPSFIAELHRETLTLDAIQDAVDRGVAHAAERYPELCVGLIGIIDRNVSMEASDAEMDFFIRRAASYVAVDLANDERGFREKGPQYAIMFQRARAAGLRTTIHSGEENVPDAAEMVRMSVETLGAERIGHGLHVHRDASVVALLRERDVPLEISVTSNWITHAVPTTAEHPIRKLLDAGVAVTINTDDPGLFGIDLVSEYALLQREHGFTREMFHEANRIAFRHSFVRTKNRWAQLFK